MEVHYLTILPKLFILLETCLQMSVIDETLNIQTDNSHTCIKAGLWPTTCSNQPEKPALRNHQLGKPTLSLEVRLSGSHTTIPSNQPHKPNSNCRQLLLTNTPKLFHGGQGSHRNQWCWNNWIFIWKKMKLVPTSYHQQKMNLR